MLVKVHKTGISGADIRIFNWHAWAQRTISTPMTVGHEYSVEVTELGANVLRLKSARVFRAKATCGVGASAQPAAFCAYFVNGQPLLAAVG